MDSEGKGIALVIYETLKDGIRSRGLKRRATIRLRLMDRVKFTLKIICLKISPSTLSIKVGKRPRPGK